MSLTSLKQPREGFPAPFPAVGRGAGFKPRNVCKRFADVAAVLHTPDFRSVYGSRDRSSDEDMPRSPKPPSHHSLTLRNGFATDGFWAIKDMTVLYENRQHGCKQVLQFRLVPVMQTRTGHRPGSPETWKLAAPFGPPASTPDCPFRREPSVRATSQDSGSVE